MIDKFHAKKKQSFDMRGDFKLPVYVSSVLECTPECFFPDSKVRLLSKKP